MKPFIIIAGMHRSGTSFLARALNLSGVYLGDLESLTLTELNADQSNPRGHWENREFIRLGIETVKTNKINYQNIPDTIKIDDNIGNELKKAVKELMNHPSLASGFKDPHALLYLTEWIEFFPKNTIIIAIFRHPLKVSESLKIRDGRSYEESLRIWKIHNIGLLKALEKYGGFVLDFDWPKERLFEELDLIRNKLGLLEVDLSDWYTDDLKRSDRSFEEKHSISKDIETIYEKLKKYSENNSHVNVDKHHPTYMEFLEILTSSSEENKKMMEFFKKEIDEVKRKLNEYEKISENKINLTTLLLAAYHKRPKLKTRFPEVSSGDLSNLLDWVAKGEFRDVKQGEDIDIIRKNLDFFKKEVKKQENSVNSDYKAEHLREELKKCKNELKTIHGSIPWKILKKIGRYRI